MNEITREQLQEVIEKEIRPSLSLHGGNISIQDWKDGVLYVRMLGECSGCPSAELTMETLVNAKLKEAFPELKQVVLVSGVSDELISQAKSILRQRRK